MIRGCLHSTKRTPVNELDLSIHHAARRSHAQEVTVNHRSQPAQRPISQYKAYLVRLWQDDTQAVWRASAQSVQNGEWVHFATLQELFAFLEIRTTEQNSEQ